jgi:hypothetical protein
MAIISVLYCLPDELHQVSRTKSMRPWKAVYEGDSEVTATAAGRASDNLV